jgi:Tol biopolymer transport system component
MYFIDGSARHFSLNYIDFATERPRKVIDLPSFFALGAPAISPDGRTFLFAGHEHSEGDIVLVEGFR